MIAFRKAFRLTVAVGIGVTVALLSYLALRSLILSMPWVDEHITPWLDERPLTRTLLGGALFLMLCCGGGSLCGYGRSSSESKVAR